MGLRPLELNLLGEKNFAAENFHAHILFSFPFCCNAHFVSKLLLQSSSNRETKRPNPIRSMSTVSSGLISACQDTKGYRWARRVSARQIQEEQLISQSMCNQRSQSWRRICRYNYVGRSSKKGYCWLTHQFPEEGKMILNFKSLIKLQTSNS